MRLMQLAMRFVKFLLIFLLVFTITGSLALVYTYYSIPKMESTTSILVLGTGGEGHTAPDLTDTIMQVVLNPTINKISVLSLPRDIWIPEIRAKINTAYHYGSFKMAGDSARSISALPVNYNLVVDFTVFRDLIDSMGGINVDVENAFVDEKFPIAGKENDLCGGDRTYACRYETISFSKGKQKMNGELVLKFIRSRNAKGDEGTDIAREKRQQKVISGIREKVLSAEVLLSYKTIGNIFDVVTSHLKTDIDKDSFLLITRFVIESNMDINYLTIPEDMLIVSQNNIKYDRQYVFLPKDGTWKELQEWIKVRI